MVSLESVGEKMSEKQWWPERENWPEFPTEELLSGTDKSFHHRFGVEQAMSLLMLEEYVIMLNTNNQCGLFVNCNDVFYSACADAEPLPPVGFGRDEVFWDLYDLIRVHGGIGAIKWCAIRRKIKPLKMYLDKIRDAGLWCERMESICYEGAG